MPPKRRTSLITDVDVTFHVKFLFDSFCQRTCCMYENIFVSVHENFRDRHSLCSTTPPRTTSKIPLPLIHSAQFHSHITSYWPICLHVMLLTCSYTSWRQMAALSPLRPAN